MHMHDPITNQKILASSRCKLIKSQGDLDPFFCKVILTPKALIFLNDEISKKDELLYHIPIDKIKDFIFTNEKTQRMNPILAFFDTIFGVYSYVIEGLGIFPKKEKVADILGLSFVNEQGEVMDFTLNMMNDGESGLVGEYKKLVR